MMKTLFTIVFNLIFIFGIYAQTFVAQVKVYGHDLWGYANEKGEMLIEPTFTNCYPFSADGFAVVYVAKTYLFIDLKGEPINTNVIGFRLMNNMKIKGFHEGLVAIKKGDRWGYLNTEGKLVISLKYTKVSNFNGGFAVVKRDNKFLILNKKGVEIEIETQDIVDLKPFSEGMAIFVNTQKKKGYINTEGKIVIPANFINLGYFHNGLAWAKIKDSKAGFINKKGEWAIKAQFDAAKNFDVVSGLARVKNKGKWGYVRADGVFLDFNFTDTYGDFYEGLALGRKGGLIGYYNAQGEWVIHPSFDAGKNFNNGYAAVRKGKKWGFIDTQGNMVTPPRYSGVKDMQKVD